MYVCMFIHCLKVYGNLLTKFGGFSQMVSESHKTFWKETFFERLFKLRIGKVEVKKPCRDSTLQVRASHIAKHDLFPQND